MTGKYKDEGGRTPVETYDAAARNAGVRIKQLQQRAYSSRDIDVYKKAIAEIISMAVHGRVSAEAAIVSLHEMAITASSKTLHLQTVEAIFQVATVMKDEDSLIDTLEFLKDIGRNGKDIDIWNLIAEKASQLAKTKPDIAEQAINILYQCTLSSNSYMLSLPVASHITSIALNYSADLNVTLSAVETLKTIATDSRALEIYIRCILDIKNIGLKTAHAETAARAILVLDELAVCGSHPDIDFRVRASKDQIMDTCGSPIHAADGRYFSRRNLQNVDEPFRRADSHEHDKKKRKPAKAEKSPYLEDIRDLFGLPKDNPAPQKSSVKTSPKPQAP